MIVPSCLCSGGELPRASLPTFVPAWALERLAATDFSAPDLRGVVVALLSQSLGAAWDALVRGIGRRAFAGARFADHVTAAASMLAAARR